MKTIKIIDLLYKRAKGEEMPKRIRIDHWCYKFEWVEHLENYYDEVADIDLTSAISMGEELNYEVEILDEEDEFEDIEELYDCCMETEDVEKEILKQNINILSDRINQLIKNQKKIIERLKDEQH